MLTLRAGTLGLVAGLGAMVLACCSTAPANQITAPPGPRESVPAGAATDGEGGSPGPATAAPPRDATTLGPVSRADCKALRGAPAVVSATVVSATSDCSGIGHVIAVLEVHRAVGTASLERVIAQTPIHGDRATKLSVGEVVIARVTPSVRPAETRRCVPVPATEGAVTHWIAVASRDAAGDLLDGVADGSLCAASSCAPLTPAPLESPKGLPGEKPHPGWASGHATYGEASELLAAGDPFAAAEAFLWCANTFSALPAGANAAIAERSAKACLDNAAHAFAAAGRFASDGRRAIGDLAVGDRPLARHARAILAAPPSDCPAAFATDDQ